MTAKLLPEPMRRLVRTSNHIERLNKELKRRSNVIGIFPNEASLLRLMGAVLIERNENILLTRHAIFRATQLQQLMKTDVPEKLIELAHEQKQLLAA